MSLQINKIAFKSAQSNNPYAVFMSNKPNVTVPMQPAPMQENVNYHNISYQNTEKDTSKSGMLDKKTAYWLFGGTAALSLGAIAVSAYTGRSSRISKTINQALNTKDLQTSLSKTITEAINSATKPITDAIEKLPEKINANEPKLIIQALKVLGIGLAGKEAIDIVNNVFTKDKTDDQIKSNGTSLADKIKANLGTLIYTKAPESAAGDVRLSPTIKQMLATESAKRISGEIPWPKIDKKNVWMVTAETRDFCKVGGMAEVGVQLPEAFNSKALKNNSGEKMSIITPLYTKIKDTANDKDETIKKYSIIKLDKPDENGYTHEYRGSGKDTIKVKSVGSVYVQVFDRNVNDYVNERVDVMKGKHNNVDYIFLNNNKFFNLDVKQPSGDEHGGGKEAYALNQNSIDEHERFAFYSKATFEIMKAVKEGNIKEIEAPNVMISNDWHASAISAMMRYVAPVMAENGEITKEMNDYIKNVPIIHITHNAKLDGADDHRADSNIRTILGRYNDAISPFIKGVNTHSDNAYPLSDGRRGNYSPVLADLNLADSVVAVSENYANEVCKSNELGASSKRACALRAKHNTMVGIINGYQKTQVMPAGKFVDSANGLMKTLGIEDKFIPFADKTGEEAYKIKLQNKTKLVKLLNAYQNKTDKDFGSNLKLMRTKPEDCQIVDKNGKELTDEQIAKIPVICDYGRFVEQKGFDEFAHSLQMVYDSLPAGQEFPVICLLGAGDHTASRDAIMALKDNMMKRNPEIGKRIFFFAGFDAGLRNAMILGSDFSAIPSRFEPCGLTQMEAMPSGTIPITSGTGGLVDTVKDGETGFVADVFYANGDSEKIRDVKRPGSGNSLLVPRNNIEAMAVTVARALNTFKNNPEQIKQMFSNAMAQDFSWDIPGGALEQYEKLMNEGVPRAGMQRGSAT